MTDEQAPAPEWIRSWIEQQRELVRRLGEARSPGRAGGSGPGDASAAGAMQDLAARWLEAGEAYLEGFARFAQSGAVDAAAVAARVGEEALSAFGANSPGHEAARRMLELLAQAPALGIAREHTEGWRELLEAQRQCQELEQALRLELMRVQNEALALLEQRVREKPVSAWRELYDLWIECGEQVWSRVAHSETYSALQAELGNATVRLRARQQRIVEHALRQLDLPTRSELNTLHRQIRELREKVAALEEQVERK